MALRLRTRRGGLALILFCCVPPVAQAGLIPLAANNPRHGMAPSPQAFAPAAAAPSVIARSTGQETVADLRLRAHDLAYNLNYDEAETAIVERIPSWPDDPSVYRSLATILWLHILFKRGSVTVDDYLGQLSKQHVAFKPPPRELSDRFRRYALHAKELAARRLATRPDDVDALYELGAVEGLMASYSATVDGKVLAAFREARRALDAHRRVLKLNPRRRDAGLVVGTYSYVVANLSWAVRMVAPLFGFRGDREGGLRLIEEAATPGSEALWEAKFGLLVLYNRERRYDDALAVIGELQARFPQNRLLWLEGGSTAQRAGRLAEAERQLEQGFAKLAADKRPRIYGEEALWRYKRGAVRVSLARYEAAVADLGAVISGEARDWVKGRARVEMGKLALQRGDRATARREFQTAALLCDRDNDPIGEGEARSLLKSTTR